MNLSSESYLTTHEEQFQQFIKKVHHQVQAPQPMNLFTGYSNLQMDIGVTIFIAFQLKNKIRLMNLCQESYLNTPEEQFQQFIEKFIFKFRPHSQSTFLLDIQISCWILELPSLEHSSSKRKIRIMNFSQESYLNTPEEQFQQFIEKFIIKFRFHNQSKFFTGYSNLQLDIGITIFRTFQLKNKIIPMNLAWANYSNTPEEQFQQFTERFTIKFRTHSQSNFSWDIQISNWILELPFLEHSSSKTISDI